MGRIPFFAILLSLLLVSAASKAQERGDGIANGGKREKRVVHDNDKYSNNNGDRGLFRRLKKEKIKLTWNSPEEKTSPDYYRSSPRGETDLGVKLGLNFQEIIKSPFSPSFNPGIVAGGYCRRFWGGSGIRGELLVNTASYTSQNPADYYAPHKAGSDTVTKSAFKAAYISIPVMFEQRCFHKLYLLLGPQYSHLISSSDKNGEFTKIYGKSNVFYKSEFSMVGGFEVQLPQRLRIGARYIKGLTDVNNSIYPKAYEAWTINTVQITFSYRLY
jgi:hypothetical protein